uniref:Uncharacterized protein n=1 Tax=Arundo donax TaxID=35708 RepID=A0A0A9D652_ARUDO
MKMMEHRPLNKMEVALQTCICSELFWQMHIEILYSTTPCLSENMIGNNQITASKMGE